MRPSGRGTDPHAVDLLAAEHVAGQAALLRVVLEVGAERGGRQERERLRDDHHVTLGAVDDGLHGDRTPLGARSVEERDDSATGHHEGGADDGHAPAGDERRDRRTREASREVRDDTGQVLDRNGATHERVLPLGAYPEETPRGGNLT